MLQNLESALQLGAIYDRNTTKYEVRMYLMGGTLLSVLPPLVLYIFTQKFFTESIERTGLVG